MLELFHKKTSSAGLVKFKWRRKKLQIEAKNTPSTKEVQAFARYRNGGEGFISWCEENVCLAIFDKYDGFGRLKSIQVMGKAELIEPFSDKYNEHAKIKKIPIEALKKMESPLNLICVTPVKMDVLFSDFKKEGYSSRQILE